ncbi:hypothetical protein CYMTET_10193 [Cymbomonas tetramitiformis]|uniref:Uncharacterized protein n=1 Tax=Cymbomonas tetramitiformis TaxID=36881 RepID=A0AAE0GR75_9CHLO|nr:hypothetical protein CYMTET_10193 [Cymbomonas tetramitiformis]
MQNTSNRSSREIAHLPGHKVGPRKFDEHPDIGTATGRTNVLYDGKRIFKIYENQVNSASAAPTTLGHSTKWETRRWAHRSFNEPGRVSGERVPFRKPRTKYGESNGKDNRMSRIDNSQRAVPGFDDSVHAAAGHRGPDDTPAILQSNSFPHLHDFGTVPKVGGPQNRSRLELREEEAAKLKHAKGYDNRLINQQHDSRIFKGGISTMKQTEHELGQRDLDRQDAALGDATKVYGEEHAGFDTCSQVKLGFYKNNYGTEGGQLGQKPIKELKADQKGDKVGEHDHVKGRINPFARGFANNQLLWVTRPAIN